MVKLLGWHAFGTVVRVENSFIPVDGVGETTERTLWEAGIDHWDRFDPDLDVVGPTRAERIDSFIQRARPRLEQGDGQFFHEQLPSNERWRLYGNFRGEACFLDIETTGLSQRHHRVTTVSFHQDGRTETLIRGQDLSRERLRDRLEATPLLVTFNGARFDVPFLETSFDLAVDTPHLDLMYPCRQANLYGGLDAVERAIGIERDLPDVSGEDAVRLWKEYEHGNDEDALDTLVEYNRADTENLRTVADAVTERLHENVFESVRSR